MTPAQMTTLAAAIRANADADVVAALAARRDDLIADWYNAASTFIVWKSAISPAEYREAIVWTEVDALTVGKARIWEWITQAMTADIDATSLNVRQGLTDCWAANTTTRTQLTAAAKRAATKAEQLFATGTGTTATPGLLVWEGILSVNDVSIALNNNP